jgi:hypothetical protein
LSCSAFAEQLQVNEYRNYNKIMFSGNCQRRELEYIPPGNTLPGDPQRAKPVSIQFVYEKKFVTT